LLLLAMLAVELAALIVSDEPRRGHQAPGFLSPVAFVSRRSRHKPSASGDIANIA
jgi:hypothetical protein